MGGCTVFNWQNFLSGCTGWNLPGWKKWIDPDVPAGCACYRAQVKALVEAYPQIDRLTLWSRRRVDPEISFTTPWRAAFLRLP